jgi:hypothetical protein
LALKNGMSVKQSSEGSPAVVAAQAKLEQELVRVVARREQLWAELEEHCETINERAARGAPVKRLLAQHNRMRERYCVVEERRQELLAQLPPPRPTTNDDF